ncbi:MAG: DNA primase [Candidatus Omnitrophota bacterium]|nr:DNA primase [Candidatus Omnitrophota bacterium]
MRYDDRIVDEVQAANDIVEVINQYAPLKRSGRNLKACCPFHQEKTASFMVSPEKQIYHCFGCGVGGDVFGFLMRYENMTFPEALRRLADQAGISLPEVSRKSEEGPSESEKLYEIYRLAAKFYRECFMKTDEGRQAREYFKNRGFDENVASEFEVGWAPDGWKNLFEFLVKKGFPQELLLKSRLINRSPKGNFYDTFRSRLLFPIHNLQGKVVAFGGRLIGDGDGPKYLNSPENPIFLKRRELFGLYVARRHIDRELPQVLIVEGYLDFLRLYAEGFKAAVATLGTALTEDHVRILKRFADEAVVIYDGDRAGEAASLRGLEVFLEQGMSVKLIRMPEGFDPDDFLKKKGTEAFRGLLASAQDFFDYKLEVLRERYDIKDALGLMKITNEFLETLAKVKQPILLDRYLRILSGTLGVDENSLRTELAKLRKRTQSRGQTLGTNTASPQKQSVRAEDEILLVSLMLLENRFCEMAMGQIEVNEFEDKAAAGVFQMLCSMHEKGEDLSWNRVLNRISDGGLKERIIASSTVSLDDREMNKAFSDCVKKVKKKQVAKRLDALRQEIAKAEKAGKVELVSAYVQEYQSLLQQRR